jgi:glycosyltransferase involved in cell wall biosynthesis
MNVGFTDCWQINLQEGFGGGEVYTGFLVKALQDLGVRCHVFVSRRATHWQTMLPPDTEIIAVDAPDDIPARLPLQSTWLLSHGGLAPALAQRLAAVHRLTGIAHMPLYGRSPEGFVYHHLVYAVSAYVRDSLRDFLRAEQVYETPLYGIARLDLQHMPASAELRQNSRYDWDHHKGRDQVLGWLEPLVEPLRAHPIWISRPGLTLGIVSRLTPIKQFPLLFSFLLPHLLAQPHVNLEIIGAGGYASVRDLSRILKPLRSRVRFWGHQNNVRAVYGKLDYLLTGLPEKEALGLNVIEAQVCGTPILAVNALPFTETVVEGITGLFYTDPRADDGMSFSHLLGKLSQQPFHIDQATAQSHIEKFSGLSFKNRISSLLNQLNAFSTAQ